MKRSHRWKPTHFWFMDLDGLTACYVAKRSNALVNGSLVSVHNPHRSTEEKTAKLTPRDDSGKDGGGAYDLLWKEDSASDGENGSEI
jgi:hypothetical protein